MADTFANLSKGLGSPATDWFAITPDDNNDLAVRPRAIRVGIAGTITVVGDSRGSGVSFTVAAGEILPLRPLRVMATGTSAGEIRGLV